MAARLFIFCLFIFLSSCATLINGDLKKVQVETDPGIRIVQVDSIASLNDLADSTAWHVFRKKAPLRIIAETDSLRDTLRIKKRLSAAYLAGNLFLYPGYVIDLFSPRRFSYPGRIHIAREPGGNGLMLHKPVRKNALYLEFGWQVYNHFYMPVFNGKAQIQGVMLGFSGGLQYCYHEKRGLLVSGGTATAGNFFAPVERFEFYGQNDFGFASYVSMRHQHVFNAVEMGYGAGCLWTHFRRTVGYGDNGFFLYSPKSFGLGTEISLHYRLGPYLRAGAVYRTVIMESRYGKKMAPGYEHAIAVELSFDGPVHRFRKKEKQPK